MNGRVGLDPTSAVEAAFRDEWRSVVATLARQHRDLDLAEECTQEAFTEALTAWGRAGVPDRPGAWLTAVARRRAIDRLRRESARAAKYRELSGDPTTSASTDDPSGVAADDVLGLVVTTCHPALAPHAQIALTLRLVAGIDTASIAAAFLVSEETMTQRIVRAKRKLRAGNLSVRTPTAAELTARLPQVLAVVQLVFNQGHLRAAGGLGDEHLDLVAEAIRLGRVLAELLPDEPEVRGLLALLLLSAARRPAQLGPGDAVVVLADQDRSRWDREMSAEGLDLVRWCLRRNQPGRYQLHAAINAVHASAATYDQTDWFQILALHDQLRLVEPTPMVELNRAVALAEVDGPDAALAVVERLPLEDYYLWHATRADLLRRTGRTAEARRSDELALERCGNPAEQRLLRRRIEACSPAVLAFGDDEAPGVPPWAPSGPRRGR